MSVLLLVQLRPAALGWGWTRVALGERPLRGVPGLRFARALGSGHEGGFGLRPSFSRQGLFACFDSQRAADAFLAGERVQAYRRQARELLVVTLRATSCRGRWDGQGIGVGAPGTAPGEPLAALTRASIRPAVAPAFWARAPAAQAGLEAAPGCRLAVGLGEAPLLRQATFSLWDDSAAMDAYARSGAHAVAIADAHRFGFFSESMFVRFRPLAVWGRWKGVHHG
ncbi:MAG: spheroidene monooxygenase [Rubrivivax sp.]|nr:spheroidene monooxygenase [Rubrivivax sp.]